MRLWGSTAIVTHGRELKTAGHPSCTAMTSSTASAGKSFGCVAQVSPRQTCMPMQQNARTRTQRLLQKKWKPADACMQSLSFKSAGKASTIGSSSAYPRGFQLVAWAACTAPFMAIARSRGNSGGVRWTVGVVPVTAVRISQDVTWNFTSDK